MALADLLGGTILWFCLGLPLQAQNAGELPTSDNRAVELASQLSQTLICRKTPSEKEGSPGTASPWELLKELSQLDPAQRTDLIELSGRVNKALSKPIADHRVRRGLRELQRLAKGLLKANEPIEQKQLVHSIRETLAALNNLARDPVPKKVDFFQTPWFFLKRLSRPVGQGTTPATNIRRTPAMDISRVDPETSTFWQRPLDIAGQDLYYGFGRSNLLLESEALCAYAAPKESFGRNPGFEIDCAGTRLKLKFAEVSSEAFATRIFSALGYHTDPTDYAQHVKLTYSRAMLREFNSRKPLQTHFTFLGWIPLFTLQLQHRYDPFDYIYRAVLKDGSSWSAAEFKSRLLRDPGRPRAEEDDSNFRPQVESTIAYLETRPANVQAKDGKSIGPWDFGQLDHASRRELRGAALLAGWLGWFDTRFDNTRLRIVRNRGELQLEHFFSDLGGVLGETGGILYDRGELPNAFSWTFTQKARSTGDSARPFPLRGYKPIARTPAFGAMTLQDARWMGRLIGALTEQQLTQALVASGFDSAQTRLYLEKLISRRDSMIQDLGLGDEIPALRKQCDHKFSYDPAKVGPVTVRVANKTVQTLIGSDRVVGGKLVKSSAPGILP